MACIVIGCDSKYNNDKERELFFRLFQRGQFNEKWIEAIRLYNGQNVDRSSKSAAICYKHFYKDYVKNLGTKMLLAANAFPTIFPKVNKKIIGLEDIKEEKTTPSNTVDEIIISDDEHVSINENSADNTNLPATSTSPNSISSHVLTENGEMEKPIQIGNASPETLINLSIKLHQRLKAKNKALAILKRTILRKNKRINRLNDLVFCLEKKKMITKNAAITLQNAVKKLASD